MYGTASTLEIEELALDEGSTLGDALARSRLARTADPGGGLTATIFGQLCGTAQPLAEGDRIELLRPLTVDAKEARRRRVAVRERRGR